MGVSDRGEDVMAEIAHQFQQDIMLQARIREIHASWSAEERRRRVEIGRQRRAEFVRLILNRQESLATFATMPYGEGRSVSQERARQLGA